MEFERGQFYEFRAVTRIHLGSVGLDILEDDILEFDGQTLRYSGHDVSLPSLRGAVKAGWLVPSADEQSVYTPLPAKIKVSPARPEDEQDFQEGLEFESVSSEEKVIGTLDEHIDKRKKAANSDMPKRSTGSASPSRMSPTNKGPTGVGVDRLSVFSDQDRERADEINRQRIAEALAANGVSKTESVEVVDTDTEEPSDEGFEVDTAPHGVVVAKYNFSDTSIGQVDDTKETSLQEATGDVQESIAGDDLPELLPDAAVGHTGKDFQWDKSSHWKTRVKKAIDDYGSRPDILKLIMAVESPGVVKAIKSHIQK